MSGHLRSGAGLAAFAFLVSLLTSPAAPASAAVDPGVPGRQYAGITSPTTGLTVVVDDLTSSPETLDYDHPVLTVTGRVRLYQPATDTYLPHSGGVVAIGPAATTTASVGEDGTFSVSMRIRAVVYNVPPSVGLLWRPDQVTADAFGSAWPYLKRIAEWPVPVAATAFRFFPDQPKLRILEGGAATLSGRLERLADGVWIPAGGVGLSTDGLYAPGAGTLPLPEALTDAAGRAKFNVTAHQDGVGEVVLSDAPTVFGGYRSTLMTAIPVDVIPKTTLRVTKHLIDRSGALELWGKFTTNQASAPQQSPTLLMQESKDGRTGWRTIARASTWVSGPDYVPSDGEFLVGTHVDHPSWYFRVTFAGTSSLQGSTSNAIRTTRRESRVVRFSVAPSTSLSGYVVLKGVLQKHTSNGWVKLGKQTKVYAVFRPKHHNPEKLSDYWVPPRRTRASGAFSFKMASTQDGWWSVWWRSTDRGLVDSYSKEVYINVP